MNFATGSAVSVRPRYKFAPRPELEGNADSGYSFKAISALFKVLDVDKSGGVDKDELRAAFVKYSALRQAIGEGPNFK